MNVYFYYVLLGVSVSAEVITLIKDQNVTCVITEESVYSAIAVVPRAEFKRPVEIIEDWSITLKDQWEYCDGTQCAETFDIVIDQRWEGFETQCSNPDNSHKGFLKLKEYKESISIYSDSITTYYNITDIKKTPLETNRNLTLSPGQWNYYTIKKSGKSVEIQGDESQNLQFNSTPYWISFSDNMCRKLHRYDFFYSVSSGQSNITINSTNCIFMYVSVDQHCFLDAQFVKNNVTVNKTINGFNQDKNLRKWNTFNITNNIDGSGDLHLWKRKGANKTDACFWAIAKMQKCRNELEFYSIHLKNNTQQDKKHICICRTLTFSENRKVFSKNLSFNCSQVLGKSYPDCKNHKFCLETGQCSCWGYHGTFCNMTCQTGFWGPNCNRTCYSGCYNCDPVNGCTQCIENFFGDQCEKKKPVLKNPPSLLKIIDDSSVTFTQNMDYGKHEVQPDLFQIEYRSTLNNKNHFQVYGNQTKYENKEQNFTLHGLSLATSSYEIRIILFANSAKNTTNNVPSLLVHQRTLSTSVSNNNLLLISWKNLHINKTLFNKYLLFYECQKCENEIISDTITTKNLSATIENTQLFETCYIHLRSEINETITLLDEIEVKLTETTIICESKESKNLSRITELVTESSKKSTKTNESTITEKEIKISVLKLTVIVASLVVVLIPTIIILIYIYKRKRQRQKRRTPVHENQPILDENYQNHASRRCQDSIELYCANSILKLLFHRDMSIRITNNFEKQVENFLNDLEFLEQLINYLNKITMSNLICILSEEEKTKNRFRTILPGESQVSLPASLALSSTYINAIIVDCYNYPKRFIVSQQPLPNTIDDFWILTRGYQINTIVSLNHEHDPHCPVFWPSVNNQLMLISDSCHVTYMNSIHKNVYSITRVLVNHRKIVNVITVKKWDRESTTPESVTVLLQIWNEIRNNSGQILVTCYDGATASGLFVALAFLVEKMIKEKVCDVFTAVKTVRKNRFQFVQYSEQLTFLFEAALAYVRNFRSFDD